MRKARLIAMVLAGSMFFSVPYTNCAAQDIIEIEQTTEVTEMIPHLMTSGDTEDLQTVSEYEINPEVYSDKAVVAPIVVTSAGIVSCNIYTRKKSTNGIINNGITGGTVTGSSISGSGIIGEDDTDNDVQGNITIGIYSDSDCTKLVGTLQDVKIDSQGNMIYSRSFEAKKNSTYYIKLTWDAESEWIAEHLFCFELQQISSESRILENGKYVKAYQGGKNSTIYYKLNVPRAGVIYAEASYDKDEFGKPKVVLCNNAKKAISVATNNNASTEYLSVFAVKKGNYYLKVSDVTGAYQFRYLFAPISDKSGKQKKSALKLTLGKKSAAGIVTISDTASQYDWYKFVLKKASKVRISLEGSTTGTSKISLEVIPPTRTATGKKINFSAKPIFSISRINAIKTARSDVWPAGTWYIRVKKSVKKGSGIYRIKVDKISK